jgi:hypothetical protein
MVALHSRLIWQDIAKGWGDDDLTVGLNFPLDGKLGQGDAADMVLHRMRNVDKPENPPAKSSKLFLCQP